MTKTISPAVTIRIDAAGDYPTWRAGKSVNTRYALANTAQMSGYIVKQPDATHDDQVNAWSGFAFDGVGKWYSAANAGHGYPTIGGTPGAGWQNHVLGIDFLVSTPQWYEIHPGSDYSAANCLIRYNDDLPCARHIYYCAQHASAAHTPDVKERILMIGCLFGWANDATSSWPQWTGTKYASGPEVEGFRIAEATWDARTRWINVQHGDFAGGQASATITDHRSGYIYQSVGGFMEYLDPSISPNGAWTLMRSQGSGLSNWNFCGALVDTIRDKIVAVLPGRSSGNSTLRLERVGLASPYTLDTIALTTQVSGGFENFAYPMTDGGNGVDQPGFVHDLDNDRYLLFRKSNTADVPVVAIDPETGDTSELSMMAPHLETGGGNGWDGRVVYSPTLGCVLCFADYWNDIAFYPTR